MSRIIEILNMDNRGEYALINVLLDDGGEAVCIVGGQVDVILHNGQIRAHVKRNKTELLDDNSST